MSDQSTASTSSNSSNGRMKPFDLALHAFGFLYDRLPGTYNGLVGVLGYRAPELVANALADHLKTTTPAILDAGCGTGLTAKAVLASTPGAVLDGFDLSPKMMREAKKTGLYRTLKPADATKTLPFEAGAYDAVVSSGLYTLGHVGPEAISPVLAMLKPGGLFALNIYDAAWEKMGFNRAFDALVQDGTVVIRTQARATHFGRIGQTCRVFVLEVVN
ncbi:MAG: class I SAM-dependent methyltransferase [Pseudomonadota bacterium]